MGDCTLHNSEQCDCQRVVSKRQQKSIPATWCRLGRSGQELGQKMDSVGPSDILKTYRENFYFNPKQSQNVKMSADWVILRPETWTEIKHNSSAKSMKNKWIYPFDSDVACLQQLFGTQQLDSTNQNRDEKGVNKTLVNQIPEKYTMSIRWTMAGDCLEQTETGQMSIPVVIIGESYLHCVGVRIKREIQVWDAVGVQAQIELGKMHQHGQSK
ncbi:uncharacterized protein LOC142340931 [Convolutriloba macropyga]|uniref:uncharacterized protein LOC142340931 n=1 Tax=Convolutriloba macropyga TaxID=536237 RepID=UPI003F52174D